MIKEITSKENKIFKDCQRLLQKKFRDQQERYIIEGMNLIEEAKENAEQVDFVVIRKNINIPSGFENVFVMDEKLFDRIAQTETSQGVMAVVKKKNYSREQLDTLCSGGGNLLILDRLQDPGNIGTIIRTATGAGYKAVVAVKGTADIYSPKVVRSAAGAVFRIPIVLVEDDREVKQLAIALGKKLVVTGFDTDNYYFDIDLSQNIALVIGNEGNGVSEELMAEADIKVKIPMKNNLESLNASVAAGILMYEAIREGKH